jgi:hypothetical protein
MTINLYSLIKELVFEEIKRRNQNEVLYEMTDHIIKFHLSYYDEIEDKLVRLLEKNKDYTIEQNFGDDFYPNDWSHILLSWHQSYLDFSPCLDNGGNISGMDREVGPLVKERAESSMPIRIGMFGPNVDEFEIFGIVHEYEIAIIHLIISNIWIQIKGPLFKTVLKSCENNSLQSFYFNDMKWNDHSYFHLNCNWKEALVSRDNDGLPTFEEIYNRIRKNG